MAPCVLYIEDNFDNLMLVRRVLQAAGFETVEATSAQEGIELARQVIPDIILIDVNMPDMDGLVATNRLRQIPALDAVPIVAVSANVMRDVQARTLDAGCDGFISKPIDVDRFPDQVLAYIRSRSS
ncbi:MAG: response regulator [Chloroflexi bacterium]|nr:response regulator [Chloroflexota bacterium]